MQNRKRLREEGRI